MIKYEQYIDLTNIKNSMQLDSRQIIAELQKDEMIITLETQGDISVSFNGESYFNYNEFPDELKELIKSNAYMQDERVYVALNNWFEIFVYKNKTDTLPKAYVADVEGMTPEELFEELMSYTKGEQT